MLKGVILEHNWFPFDSCLALAFVLVSVNNWQNKNNSESELNWLNENYERVSLHHHKEKVPCKKQPVVPCLNLR